MTPSKWQSEKESLMWSSAASSVMELCPSALQCLNLRSDINLNVLFLVSACENCWWRLVSIVGDTLGEIWRRWETDLWPCWPRRRKSVLAIWSHCIHSPVVHVVYDSVQLIWCVIKDIVIHRSVLILCFIRLKTPRGWYIMILSSSTHTCIIWSINKSWCFCR